VHPANLALKWRPPDFPSFPIAIGQIVAGGVPGGVGVAGVPPPPPPHLALKWRPAALARFPSVYSQSASAWLASSAAAAMTTVASKRVFIFFVICGNRGVLLFGVVFGVRRLPERVTESTI
jgi:hypothetical protein